MNPKKTQSDIDAFVKANPGCVSYQSASRAVQTIQLCDEKIEDWLTKLRGLCVDDDREAAIAIVVKEFESQYQGGLSGGLDERFRAHFDMLVEARKAWQTPEDAGDWDRIVQDYNGKVVENHAACMRRLKIPEADVQQFLRACPINSK